MGNLAHGVLMRMGLSMLTEMFRLIVSLEGFINTKIKLNLGLSVAIFVVHTVNLRH